MFRIVKRIFLKGKTIRKGSSKQKLRVDIIEMLDDIKESEIVCSNVTVKITIGHIKIVFGNSLIQKHGYYHITTI
jgi:hypothetical protein